MSSKPFRGGRVFVDGETPEQHKPLRLSYPCFAAGCPMPGTIWPDVTQGGSGDRPGTCAWHYGVKPSDIPRVTQVLRDWMCVSYEVNEARRVLTGELARDPRALEAAMAVAWQRLQPLASGWDEQLAPGHRTNRAGLVYRETYGDWAKKLEAFVGGRVQEALSPHRRSAA